MNRLILLIAFLTPSVAGAQSLAVHQYEARMSIAAENYGLAQRASACGLRSYAWLDTFDVAYALFASQEAGRLGLSLDDVRSVEPKLTLIFSKAATVDEKKCQAMTNSSVMSKLDRIEFNARGGYH